MIEYTLLIFKGMDMNIVNELPNDIVLKHGLPDHKYCNIMAVGAINGYVVVECSICKEYSELFGTGLFRMLKAKYLLGNLPCGCSAAPKWNSEQQGLRLSRVLESTKYTLVDAEEYKQQTTKITLSCPTHGEWKTTYLSVFQGRGCKQCSIEHTTQIVNKKSISEMSERFMVNGNFPEGTKFQRSDRRTSQGAKNYWKVYYPICDEWGEAATSDLHKGNRCCDCCKDFRESYINLISDNGVPVALKFGITKNLKERLYRQNLKTSFEVTNIFRWSYSNKQDCTSSELVAKNSVITPKLQNFEFKDGWTETCDLSWLETLIKIFSDKGTALQEI